MPCRDDRRVVVRRFDRCAEVVPSLAGSGRDLVVRLDGPDVLEGNGQRGVGGLAPQAQAGGDAALGTHLAVEAEAVASTALVVADMGDRPADVELEQRADPVPDLQRL